MMNLMPGRNTGLLKIMKPWREIWMRDVLVPFNIYFYSQAARFVAFDVDDTRTERKHGLMLPGWELYNRKTDAIELVDKLEKNGYHVVYLTSRPYTESQEIRSHLFESMRMINGYSVPMGPLFMAPRAFKDAVTNVYKTMHLINFGELFYEQEDVFRGAYGHVDNDVDVYMESGIKANFTYLIDNDGKMYNLDTKEETSYREQADVIDIIYPRMPATLNVHIASVFAKLLFRLAEVCNPASMTPETTTAVANVVAGNP